MAYVNDFQAKKEFLDKINNKARNLFQLSMKILRKRINTDEKKKKTRLGKS